MSSNHLLVQKFSLLSTLQANWANEGGLQYDGESPLIHVNSVEMSSKHSYIPLALLFRWWSHLESMQLTFIICCPGAPFCLKSTGAKHHPLRVGTYYSHFSLSFLVTVGGKNGPINLQKVFPVKSKISHDLSKSGFRNWEEGRSKQ